MEMSCNVPAWKQGIKAFQLITYHSDFGQYSCKVKPMLDKGLITYIKITYVTLQSPTNGLAGSVSMSSNNLSSVTEV